MTLKTMFGDITLPVEYGRDTVCDKIVMPFHFAVGVHGHEPMSPALEDRLCHLIITAISYERAAEAARRFRIAMGE